MRKVELRMNELEKFNVIKKLVDTNGNKKRAAIRLGCTTRTIASSSVIRNSERQVLSMETAIESRLPPSLWKSKIKSLLFI